MRCPLLFYLKIIHSNEIHTFHWKWAAVNFLCQPFSVAHSVAALSFCSFLSIMISTIKSTTEREKRKERNNNVRRVMNTHTPCILTQKQTNKQNAIWWKTNLFIMSLCWLLFLSAQFALWLARSHARAFQLSICGLCTQHTTLVLMMYICLFVNLFSTLHCSNSRVESGSSLIRFFFIFSLSSM